MKAILVIKMPKNCHDCPLNSHTDFDFDVCWVTQKDPSWCPLKPMPKKYELTTEKGNRYAVGWNDCIDEILGEE